MRRIDALRVCVRNGVLLTGVVILTLTGLGFRGPGVQRKLGGFPGVILLTGF